MYIAMHTIASRCIDPQADGWGRPLTSSPPSWAAPRG